MTAKGMCDSVNDQHQIADRFGSLTQSQDGAIAQICRAGLNVRQRLKVLDFGVGNGEFLRKLHECLPAAELTGIDVSLKMSEEVKKTLPLRTIETNVSEASNFLPAHSQDVVLAHFINALIPLNTLFEQAKLLSRATGYFSLITTTYDSFPIAQERLANFIASDSLLSSIVGHYYKSMVKNTTVAAGLEELMSTFRAHDFEIVEHQRLEVPITLHNIEELAQFGIEGTWFLNSIALRMLPKNFVVSRLKRLFTKIFTFPYQDTHIIDVVLAKK